MAMKVGVIGLGTMGMGAALNLHRKGHEVVGCELREASRAAFVAAGGRAVASPVLEHRILLRPESELEGVRISEVLQRILHEVPVPR